MISELSKHDFDKCNSLINEQGQLEVKAVIEGINPGRIFVDDIISPSSGLVWLGNNDGFFFIGNEENEGFTRQINDFVETVIKPEAMNVGLNWFEGIGNHPKWNKVIERIFEHRKLESWNQRVYMIQEENYLAKGEPKLETGYKIKKIDRTLYENKKNEISNIEYLHSKILEAWSSPDDFFEQGIGYCIVHDNKIVSICYSVFVVEDVHSVAIETLESYRGRKLAQGLAHRFVKDCLERDGLPYWDCMEDNKPSIAIAERLGFTNVFGYVGYYFPF
ncbi:GNAT family N-acetyltransferase [Ornithinibacillus californiensis]|uniref:GNAT family N-acetyltransferase n=1 Tax=Ornithinibacillus californiensis TaxID=161536 RepID=UPI00064DBCAA|nr:GNAT family N-acetyltransferase [Ornithinibacillus californiensis]